MGKNLRSAENYSIGLDIGTGSVGWAVVDENGELYYFKSKPTWGSRLFPSAEPASVARLPRGQRRRYDRRRQRLDLLQELFCEEMQNTDAEFFIRLKQSRLLPEDRMEGHRDYRWPLFNGSDFTERDYYQRFPTIYHLRKWLMETDEPADLRLIYLAFHNIVKTRGNFLHQDNPSLSAKSANMAEALNQLKGALEPWCADRDLECEVRVKKIQEVLEDPSLRRADKRDKVIPFFGLSSDQQRRAKELAGAMLGYKVDFNIVFDTEGDAAKFSLGNDESTDAFFASCPDDVLPIFEALQAAYLSHILIGMLKDGQGQTISYCKVHEYERYGEDLKLLKQLVRDFAPTKYDDFFRGPHYSAPYQKDYNPAKARGYTRYNLGTSWSDYDGFFKDVKNLLENTPAKNDERYKQMKQLFEDGVFLRRLKTSDNGSIPYQLHLEEMRAIIDNQGKHHPFLIEQREKIESLVTFRIPYYVGPLTTKNARRVHDKPDGEMRFAWAERLEGQESAKVYPWNWEEIIDKDKSAKNFIRRMTGTCTYLQGEPVLPRCSLLYEKYCVLNELNGARYTQDGDKKYRFDASDRYAIFEELFKQGAVTYKKVEDWLKRRNYRHPHVSGGQGETKFESKLSAHLFFCRVLGVDDIDETLEPMVEELILWNTLFEDRDILREKIQRSYGDCLTNDQIKQICKKRFTGWGRLSKRFLCELKAETACGPMSIMDILEQGNPEGNHVGSAMVLMEILHDEHFGFTGLIERANLKSAEEKGGLSVDELPGSPALRRGVNQALRIVKEITSIAGKPPTNIYIEVTRDDDAGKKGRRTTRRYDGLKEALKALEVDGAESLNELRGISAEQLDQRLSLYFMQNGKSLYSGKPLDIRRVMSGDEAYQVDHIIPRSYVKDDSFENLALVLSEENQRKTDDLLLDSSIRRKMGGYWRALHDAGLIGDKKFNNLMRDCITDRQIQGFINRQLVETSQIVKFTRLMLGELYPDTNVESIKSSLAHQLREECGFVKCREANNFHHAHDALLAAEIGRFIQLRHPGLFDNPIGSTRAMRDFIRSRSEYYRKNHRMPGTATFVIGSFLTSGFDKETGEVYKDTWDAEAECAKIRRFLNYKQCYISRMPEITSGAFWDATIYSPKEPKKKLSLPLKKGLDPYKYGSYSREQFAYFFVYKAQKKRKAVLEYAPVPVSVAAKVECDPLALEEYAKFVSELKGIEFIQVVRRKIPKYQVIELDANRLYITGIKEVRNATEIAFSQSETALVAQLVAGKALSADVAKALFESFLNQCDAIAKKLTKQMKLLDLQAKFESAPPDIQRKVQLALISIINASTNMVDLSDIGGPKFAGCMNVSFSKEMSSTNSTLTFIDQSVTGMFERRQRLEL